MEFLGVLSIIKRPLKLVETQTWPLSHNWANPWLVIQLRLQVNANRTRKCNNEWPKTSARVGKSHSLCGIWEILLVFTWSLVLAFDWRFQAMGLEACASATAWCNIAWYSECEDENVCSSSEFQGIDKGLKGEPTDTQTLYSAGCRRLSEGSKERAVISFLRGLIL